MAIGREVLGDLWAKTQANAKKAELAELMQRVFAGETVPGIRTDQRARALTWIPEAMSL